MNRFAHAIIRVSALLAPARLRARWREEWLAELNVIPAGRSGLAYAAGAPWDALSSRWTVIAPRLWPSGAECRQAWRSVRRAPWFACATASVIALGIAFAATIFAVVDGVLLKPLPYEAPDQLFGVVENRYPSSGRPEPARPSPVQLDRWRDALPEVRFAAYLGFRGGTLIVRSGPRAETVTNVRVGEGFLEMLGVNRLFGRFVPADFTAQTRVPSAIVSYEFWQRWDGGDPAAIGRSIVADDGSGIRVVGILPRDFIAPWGFTADVVTPLVNEANSRERGVSVLVRAPAGWTGERIAGRVSAVNASLASEWPVSTATNTSVRMRNTPIGDVRLTPLREVLTRQTRATAWLVLALAICLMALGCVNVGGLTAARVQDRWRDLVLRRALGAGSWDLVRLLAIENAVVVAGGAVAGIVISAPLLRLTVGLMPDPRQFLKLPAIDGRVMAFAALAASISVALITVVAASRIRGTNARSALADGPATSPRVRRSLWSFVSVQIALACVVAVGGALVAGSLVRVWLEDPGFDMTRTARIRVSPARGATAEDIETLMADLRKLPGVADAGGVTGGVLDGSQFTGSDFDAPPNIPPPPPEYGIAPGSIGVLLASMRITNGYLETAGLTAVDGRLPTPEEFENGAPVLVVSESVARAYWPDGRAIGQTLVSNQFMRAPMRAFTVVGVVPDARYAALDRDAIGAIYYPNGANPRPWLGNVLIRLDASSTTSLAGVGMWLRERCPRCTVYGQPEPLNDLAAVSILPRTFYAWLFASFGIASIIVAGSGILGLMAMTSSRRTKEIGIRLALGATPARVALQMLREQIGAVLFGLLMGGMTAAWAVRFVQSYLYKLTVYDRSSWMTAVGMLLLAAMIGALIPSVRASRLDPVEALRTD